jgi:metal-responsive CopG/Arc/MetJ family transcriptional regulator
MRLHITLEDELIARLDSQVGPRQRSAFISQTIRKALDDESRWSDIEASLGALADRKHDWDADPEQWVREQRAADTARLG